MFTNEINMGVKKHWHHENEHLNLEGQYKTLFKVFHKYLQGTVVAENVSENQNAMWWRNVFCENDINFSVSSTTLGLWFDTNRNLKMLRLALSQTAFFIGKILII